MSLLPTDSEVKSCVDIGDSSSVEMVDDLCYLGDMLCWWRCWCCCDCQELHRLV